MTQELKFSEKSQDYAKSRPSYPDESIDKILEGFGQPSQLTIVDVGAGTGIASRQLAERGVHVVAVEPDAAMIDAAEPHPLIKFQQSGAETIDLPDNFAEIITSFTAFHWFKFDKSLREFRRILKPSGRLALVWNTWDPTDPFTGRYVGLLLAAAREHSLAKSGSSPIARLTKRIPSVSKIQMRLLRERLWMPYFKDVRCDHFRHEQLADLSTLISCARSQSYVPHEGPIWDKLVAELARLVENSDSSNYLIYDTAVYSGTPKK